MRKSAGLVIRASRELSESRAPAATAAATASHMAVAQAGSEASVARRCGARCTYRPPAALGRRTWPGRPSRSEPVRGASHPLFNEE